MSSPASPAAPKRNLKTILIIVGVVLVVCCGGAAAAGFLLFKGLSVATAPAREAANVFLGDLESGDTADAYDSLCAAVRAEYTLTDFERVVESQPKLDGHTITGVSVNNTNGVVTGSVDVSLRYADGTSQATSIRLVSDGGTWRVCGDPY